jgi:hypothetical protein
LTSRGKSLLGRIYDFVFWFRWRRAHPSLQ